MLNYLADILGLDEDYLWLWFVGPRTYGYCLRTDVQGDPQRKEQDRGRLGGSNVCGYKII